MTSGIEIKLNVECPIVKLNHENFRMVIKEESKEGKTNSDIKSWLELGNNKFGFDLRSIHSI